ncbi:MAG TPA: HDOD domain-containing protein [Desulfobacteraceae bacterium]|nr:HDOD domain-containing protein [Desulfobacteraceae bacterium]
MISLQELIKEIKNLEPVPAVVNQLLASADDPHCSMTTISDIVQYDPAITANLIRTCNSAYFGLSNPVESVRDAVSLLGMDQIVELVLLNNSRKALSKKQKGYGLDKGAMWRYSVSSALIARGISQKTDAENHNTLFTAALLKDIGKTVLDRFVTNAFDKITHLVKDEGYSFSEAEKQLIGIDHAELGAMIVKIWKFSPTMVKIIRHHHLSDENLRNDRDIATVYLADCICMMMGIGVGADGLAYRFHGDVLQNLNINSDDLSHIIADFTFNMKKFETLLQLV